MLKYVILLMALTAGQAHADFEYSCRVSSTQACRGEFRALSDAGAVRQSGAPDPSVSDFSAACGLTNEAVNCSDNGWGWSCRIHSATCSEVSPSTNLSYPPVFTCQQGSGYRVVFGQKASGGEWGSPSGTEILPLFCVKKETAAAASPAAADAPSAAW